MSLHVLALVLIVGGFCATANGQRQAQCCEEYCYDLDTDRSQSLHFGTKTAYQVIKGSGNNRQYEVQSN